MEAQPMSDLLERCEVCGALVDEEDLFCANCGREVPGHRREATPTAQRTYTHQFTCSGCGASMSYDAAAQSLRCPFCGSTKLAQQTDQQALSPQAVIPFAFDQQQAVTVMRRWLGASFWRPSDLSKAAVVTKIAAVYVPFWSFRADTHTYWTGDTSQTPPRARASWYPVTGEHRGRYDGVLVGASSVLTPAEMFGITPYDLTQRKPPDEVDLDNVVVEQFRVQRKYARPFARQRIDDLERAACHHYIPGRARNVKVNVRLSNLASEPILLPVWIMAYRYGDQVYRVLVNGQNGKISGQAPFSWAKAALVAAIVAGGLLFVFFLFLLAAALSG